MNCRNDFSFCKKIGFLSLLYAVLSVPLVGQITFKTVVSFDNQVLPNPGDFGSPQGPTPLVQGREGKLYGTTQGGGIPGCAKNGSGTAFKLTPPPQVVKLTSLHTFATCTSGDGQYPSSGVILATNGSFYGTTYQGGTQVGTVFKITSAGTVTTYNFTNPTDGDEPVGGLLQATNGYFYGTTTKGGGTNLCGSIFKMNSAGTLTPLYHFPAGCVGPYGNLIEGTDGNIYGTNWSGGSHNMGWIFKVDSAGNVSPMHDFEGQPSDGAFPGAGLVQGSDGNFYGTTCGGGNANSGGTVFRMKPDGTVTVLVNFTAAGIPGQCPEAPLIQATDGNFYGTTVFGGNPLPCSASTTCGTIFQLNSAGQYLQTLHEFDYSDKTDPWAPAGGLVQYTDGTFYGLTASGGSSTNCNVGCGAIYHLIVPGLAPFVVLSPTSAKVGTVVAILGQGFSTSTVSAVDFNGTPATFSVKSGTYLTAKVPTGATTGFVTVKTTTRTLKSNVRFQVLP